ncbi:MAG: hypothetical protein PHN45_10380 [Methylococcales bacterium]|nr:hypothetical protein [Methylococcales bacterium]MDD5755143.1 hypothetical protein [Methylococcales bacterium]
MKHIATVPIITDNEILTWFKSKGGRNYQHMINKALFDYVQQYNHT